MVKRIFQKPRLGIDNGSNTLTMDRQHKLGEKEEGNKPFEKSLEEKPEGNNYCFCCGKVRKTNEVFLEDICEQDTGKFVQFCDECLKHSELIQTDLIAVTKIRTACLCVYKNFMKEE